jgi:hypothetical protein
MKAGQLRIVCPHCKKKTLENTEAFDPGKIPDGTMFQPIPGVRLRQGHRQQRNVRQQSFTCPNCFMPLPINGRGALKLVDIAPKPLEKKAPAKKTAPKKKTREKDPVKRTRKKK